MQLVFFYLLGGTPHWSQSPISTLFFFFFQISLKIKQFDTIFLEFSIFLVIYINFSYFISFGMYILNNFMESENLVFFFFCRYSLSGWAHACDLQVVQFEKVSSSNFFRTINSFFFFSIIFQFTFFFLQFLRIWDVRDFYTAPSATVTDA